MPQYLISDGSDLPKFARVDGSGASAKLVFVEQENATGFQTPEEARAMADAACSAMIAAGERKAAKAIEKGEIVKEHGHFVHQKSDRYSYNLLELCVPAWLWRLKENKRVLPLSSRPSAEDVYGVFETFYVRSDQGWLCRSMVRRDSGSLVWGDAFGLAVPFSSQEAAETELGRLKFGGHVLKTSSVFTGVSVFKDAEADDLSDGVRAACEARDIGSALEQSAQERLTAMRGKSAASEPLAKKSARL